MTQEPRQEVEVQGRAGEPVALPVGNDGATPYIWTLDLPDGVEEARTTSGRLTVRAVEAGSYVLAGTLARAGSPTPMTVLEMRLTVV